MITMFYPNAYTEARKAQKQRMINSLISIMNKEFNDARSLLREQQMETEYLVKLLGLSGTKVGRTRLALFRLALLRLSPPQKNFDKKMKIFFEKCFKQANESFFSNN